MHHTLWEERISIFIGANAILQFVGDVILEVMGLIPPRINHLSLTFLNAFISFKTLSAIQKDKFKFLHEDCQIFWLLELLLIVGDVYYSFKDSWGRQFILVRLFFVCCSMFNWVFISYIIIRYKLYHITYQGHVEEENESFIDKEDDEEHDHDGVSNAMTAQISANSANTNVSASGQGDGEEAKNGVEMDKAESVPMAAMEEETESIDDSYSHDKLPSTEPAQRSLKGHEHGRGHGHGQSEQNGHEHMVEIVPTFTNTGKRSLTGTHSEVP